MASMASPVPAARRPREDEDGFDHRIILIAAAGERLRPRDVEPAVANEGLVNMDADDLAEDRTLPLVLPARLRISTTSTTLHSSEAGLSLTRGAATRRHSAIVRPAWMNSFSPRGSGAEVAFMASLSADVARLATNSPLSLAKVAESLYPPSLEKPTIGGGLPKPLKKL